MQLVGWLSPFTSLYQEEDERTTTGTNTTSRSNMIENTNWDLDSLKWPPDENLQQGGPESTLGAGVWNDVSFSLLSV